MTGVPTATGPVVPEKLPNNAQGGAAEAVEGSGPAKGNTASETRPGRGAGQGAPSELDRVRRVAATDKEARFTALLHHVDVDRLRAAYWALAAEGRAGGGRRDVGGLRAWISRRTFGIFMLVSTGAHTGRGRRGGCSSRSRTGGCGRSGSPRLEDKILQRAVVEVLNAIYEADFLGFSAG